MKKAYKKTGQSQKDRHESDFKEPSNWNKAFDLNELGMSDEEHEKFLENYYASETSPIYGVYISAYEDEAISKKIWPLIADVRNIPIENVGNVFSKKGGKVIEHVSLIEAQKVAELFKETGVVPQLTVEGCC